ncbi:MAG TPA: hemerythrin domain-containing protein [Candidatus Acidoferrales bacterium]|nr:hemerythrin domain-containing protein [Candidatus Acidoferrales bacterium]
MLKWTEKFETGNALLDAQHRMLITYINRLEPFTRVTNPTPQEIDLFLRVVEFLENYALTHFKDEENCMLRFKCPAYRDNKQAHTEFLDFYRQFSRRLSFEGCRPELVKELHQACVAWIQRHILRIDVQLKSSLEQVATGGGPN